MSNIWSTCIHNSAAPYDNKPFAGCGLKHMNVTLYGHSQQPDNNQP